MNFFICISSSLDNYYRMNEITAAVVLGQLEKVDQLVDRRITVAKLFLSAIKGFRQPINLSFG